MEIAGIHNSDWITVRERGVECRGLSTAVSLSFSLSPCPTAPPSPPPLALVDLEDEES
jgi:hypothetical protein